MIIPNIWENKKCSKPPTSEVSSLAEDFATAWHPEVATRNFWSLCTCNADSWIALFLGRPRIGTNWSRQKKGKIKHSRWRDSSNIPHVHHFALKMSKSHAFPILSPCIGRTWGTQPPWLAPLEKLSHLSFPCLYPQLSSIYNYRWNFHEINHPAIGVAISIESRDINSPVMDIIIFVTFHNLNP